MHPLVFAFAARLLQGFQIDIEDRHGRLWRASAGALTLEPQGLAVLTGSAYEVAVAALRLAEYTPRDTPSALFACLMG